MRKKMSRGHRIHASLRGSVQYESNTCAVRFARSVHHKTVRPSRGVSDCSVPVITLPILLHDEPDYRVKSRCIACTNCFGTARDFNSVLVHGQKMNEMKAHVSLIAYLIMIMFEQNKI